MPELPDITVYIDRLAPRVVGQVIDGVEVRNVFVLRTADPAITVRRDTGETAVGPVAGLSLTVSLSISSISRRASAMSRSRLC